MSVDDEHDACTRVFEELLDNFILELAQEHGTGDRSEYEDERREWMAKWEQRRKSSAGRAAMTSEVHYYEGDTYPPITLGDSHGPIDLSAAARVIERVVYRDGRVHERDVPIIDASAGRVRPPALEAGDYGLEYEIVWAAGRHEIIPTEPTILVVHPDAADVP